jgi:protein-tyrosine phosphatase
MIDLHSHILPDVDDGVRSDEEALAFARVAVEDGIRTVVATPHCNEGSWFNDREAVLSGVERLRALLAREEIPLQIEPGAEVRLCPELVERVRDGRAPTLGDNGKTLLLELSLSQYPVGLEQLVFQLKLAGIEPLFAHPERIAYFQDDLRRYEEVVRLGAFGQLTSGSVLGRFGSTVRDFSEELVRKGLVHVLATDAHDLEARAPRLSDGREALAALVGEDRAAAMCEESPRALLEGRAPRLPEVVEQAPSRGDGLLSRLFRRR